MRRLTFIMLALLLTGHTHALYAKTVNSGISCHAFVNSYKRNALQSFGYGFASPEYTAKIHWLVGFFSAYNYYGKGSGNITAGISNHAWASWINNWCTRQPSKDIRDAAVAFIQLGSQERNKLKLPQPSTSSRQTSQSLKGQSPAKPSKNKKATAQTVSKVAASGPKHTLKSLQNALNACGYNAGAADGIWGKRTAAALERFQTDMGLPPSNAKRSALHDKRLWETLAICK